MLDRIMRASQDYRYIRCDAIVRSAFEVTEESVANK
jgi:hypothetical protein